MNNQEKSNKLIIVHVGPHKTGSTAIQKWFHENSAFLKAKGLAFVQTRDTHLAAKLIASQRYVEAEGLLNTLTPKISEMSNQTIILSQEDFAGELPGRTRKRGIYPRIAKNLRIIRRALSPHQVVFVFFERPKVDWLRSCYHQHLTLRTQFSDFSTFLEYFSPLPSWDEVFGKVEATLNDTIRRVSYDRAADRGVRSILAAADVHDADLPTVPDRANQSPSSESISALERINSFTSFPPTAWFAKRLLLEGWMPKESAVVNQEELAEDRRSASIALPQLLERVTRRISSQDVDDLLPPEDADLNAYLYERLPTDAELPNLSRVDMHNQSLLLDYHLRGKSELAKLNALSISYLRRDTSVTPKARNLFHRIWREYGVFLVNELSSRWLISTLQTFLDHGRNEAQRSIGACGYFYANMMKIYEGERAIEGLEQDGLLAGVEPQTTGKFRGLDRYQIGGTDLLLNTNALALELSLRDGVAGLVLQEFLLRVKFSGNVFTRNDETRLARGVESEGFKDTWSFFAKPKGKSGPDDLDQD